MRVRERERKSMQIHLFISLMERLEKINMRRLKTEDGKKFWPQQKQRQLNKVNLTESAAAGIILLLWLLLCFQKQIFINLSVFFY